jgi:membrane protein DedA with SNARE-associated domain
VPLILYPNAPRPSYADQVLSFYRNLCWSPRKSRSLRGSVDDVLITAAIDPRMAAIEHAFGNLTPLLQEYGVAAVALILMLESLGLPVPGESLLILASVLAARGDLSLPSLLVFAWAGAVVGDNIGYVLGRTFGRAVVLRLGGRIGFEADRLRQVEEMFARYGPLTVGFARFFPILRQLNGVVAGTLVMEWRRFLRRALGAGLGPAGIFPRRTRR